MKNVKAALVTGASSGIGRCIAENLSKKGYKVYISARREDRLLELKARLSDCEAITADLSKKEECFGLYEKVKDKNISVVVNCAGFGVFGEFSETNLDRELEMIDLNISAVHILTKLFLKDFVKKDSGYILNVASSAGLLPAGPFMSTYYASKSYVASLTSAIARELKERGSKVYVGALCPGPVDTEFNSVANVKFNVKSISAKECADYAVKKMFERKTVIVPSLQIKAGIFSQRLLPRSTATAITGEIQKRKKI